MDIAYFKFGPGLEIISGADTVPLESLKYLHECNGSRDTTLVGGLNIYTDRKPWFWAGYTVARVNGVVSGNERYDSVEQLVDRLMGERPEIVHVHTRGKCVADVASKFKSRGSSVLYTVHGLDGLIGGESGDMSRSLIETADVVTTPSIFSMNAVRAAYPGHAGKIIAFPNATSLGDYFNDEGVSAMADNIRKRFAPNGEKIVLTTCRLQDEKGIYETGRAVCDLVNKGYDIMLLHAGPVFDDADRERLVQIFRDAGVENKLVLYGKVEAGQNPRDMASLYKAADIFVLPSYMELFCMSALEALAFSIPSVISNVGGASDTFVKPGFVVGVPPKDSEAVADAVRYVLDNYDKERQRAVDASAFIAARYHSKIVTSDLYRLYERLLAGEDVTAASFRLEDDSCFAISS